MHSRDAIPGRAPRQVTQVPHGSQQEREAVDDHVTDDDDATGAHHRYAGEREPRSLVREREQQREAQAARDGDEHGPRCAERCTARSE